MRVLLVEDHDLIAQGVAVALRAEGLEADVADDLAPAAVVARVERDRPDVVLLDLHVDDTGGTSLPLIGPIAATGAKVVMLTGVTDRIELAACVEAGAWGIGSKAESFVSVLDKVLRTAADEVVLPVNERVQLLDELAAHRRSERELMAPFDQLTQKESETLALLLEGRQAEWIAAATFVSLATVRSHIRGVLAKLGVSSQLAAVAAARRAGWTAPAVHQS